VDLRWHGLRIEPSAKADREMRHLDLYMEDVVEILERGSDCSRSQRSRGVFERCLWHRGRIRKAVVVRSAQVWSGEEVWLVLHVGELHEPST